MMRNSLRIFPVFLLAGPISEHTQVNSRIQVLKENNTNDKNFTKCEFCAAVKKYVYKDLKGLYHKTSECFITILALPGLSSTLAGLMV